MKRKVVLYIGMDDDGTDEWAMNGARMQWREGVTGGRLEGFFKGIKNGELHVCHEEARRVFGAPPCKPGKQVKVTLQVEKIEKVEE